MNKLKTVDLFAGIGGFSLGLESTGGFETIAFCEIDQFCKSILRKHWPKIKIYNDVREVKCEQFRGTVDVICGGFPCQDLSGAGKQKGINAERSGLYSEMLRIISGSGPKYAIFENVTDLLSGEQGRWFAKFLYDLAQIGYDAEWHCISASELGEAHHRDRAWIIAYPNGTVMEGLHFQKPLFPYPKESRRRKRTRAIDETISTDDYAKLLEDANGVPGRLDRLKNELKAYGNSVVPAIPKIIGEAILRHERENNLNHSKQT